MKLALLTFIALAIFSCDKGAKDPESLIGMYVKDLTQKTVGREYFDKYTTGKLLETVQNLNDEEFKKFINLKRVKQPSVEVVNKNCTEKTCRLTYIVKYSLLSKGKNAFDSEVKKIAVVKKIGEVWKIAEVSNIKTYIEGKLPIKVTSP